MSDGRSGVFADRLRALRERAVLTEEELAEQGSLPATAIDAPASHTPERGGRRRPQPRTLRAFADALAQLVVLDNVEHVLEAAADVADLPARCPRLVVLATSRAAPRVRTKRDVELGAVVHPLEQVAGLAVGHPAHRLQGAEPLRLGAAVPQRAEDGDSAGRRGRGGTAGCRPRAPAILCRVSRPGPRLSAGPCRHPSPSRRPSRRWTPRWGPAGARSRSPQPSEEQP